MTDNDSLLDLTVALGEVAGSLCRMQYRTQHPHTNDDVGYDLRRDLAELIETASEWAERLGAG